MKVGVVGLLTGLVDLPVLVNVGNPLLTNLTGHFHALMDPLMMPSQVGELGELLSTDVASAVAGRVHCGVGASHVLVKICRRDG